MNSSDYIVFLFRVTFTIYFAKELGIGIARIICELISIVLGIN